jgi:membrane protein
MNEPLRRAPMWAFVVRVVTRSVQAFLEDAGPHLAGSIAYRVLFSLFPLAIVLTAVFGIVLQVSGLQADVVGTIVSNVPLSPQGQADLTDLLEGATGRLSGIGLVALVGLVWAASGMMAAIREGLNRAWNVESRRPFVRGKAVDVALVFATSLLVLLSLSIAIGTRFLERYAGDVRAGGHIASGALAWGAGLAGPFALVFVTVLFLYRVVPAQPPRMADLWAAVTFVALVFALLQNLFALYLEHFSNYNAVYGSLGAVIAFLFFVYLAAIVFLFGAELAALRPLVRAELERGRVQPDGRRPRGRIKLRPILRGLFVRRRPDLGARGRESPPSERPRHDTRLSRADVELDSAVAPQAREKISDVGVHPDGVRVPRDA